MTKFCPKCGTDNDDDSTFCRNCGERLSGINTLNTKKDNENNKIFLAAIIVLLIAIAIIGIYAVIGLNNNSDNIVVVNDSNSSASDNSNVNTKSWHKIDSFNGVGDFSITLNSKGNPTRIVSSAMPLQNYADNYMVTTVDKNGYTVGISNLTWNSTNTASKKSDTIEFTGSGTYFISVSAYELEYWNLEIYEYY